jgi:Domain of unknown function (DUF5069)
MEPLDLTTRPPRGPRETLLGLMFLPRTIDKLRAEMPGGRVGAYLNHDHGFSAYALRRAGIDMEQLRGVVGSANDEAEVTAWLRERVDPEVAAEVNRKLESFTVARMSPDDQVLIRERHPVMAKRPELDRVLDVLEADDADAFGQPAR